MNAVDNFSRTFRKAAGQTATLAEKMSLAARAVRSMAYEIAALAFVMVVDLIGQAAEAAAAIDRLTRRAAIFAEGAGASIEELGRTEAEFRAIVLDANRLQMFTPIQIAQTIEFLALAGATNDEINKMINSVGHLAYVTGTELADAGRISLNVMRAFGMEIHELGAIQDALFVTTTSTMQSMTDLGQAMKYAAPAMHAAGRSVEETATAIGLLANAGLKGTQAGTALRQTVAQLLKPTDESLRLQARYNLTLVELTPAALKAKESLRVMGKSVEKLNVVIERVETDIKSLQYSMEELAIGTTENQLQIMAIRLKASKQGRDLTTDEMERIRKLEHANDVLAYESTQSQLEIMKVGHIASGASLGVDKLTQSEKEMADVARTGIKGIRPLEDILRELEKVGDDTAVVFELFGIRSATAVLALREAMYESEMGADSFAKLHGQAAAAAATAMSETEAAYEYATKGAGAALDIMTSKVETYTTQIGEELLPLYQQWKGAMTEAKGWIAEHADSIGAMVDFLGKLAGILGKVLDILVKYPEVMGVLIGYWIAMKLAIPVQALIRFIQWLRLAFAVMKVEGFEIAIATNRFDNLALAAAGAGAAVGGIITALRMFGAESKKARQQAALMTAVQWSLSAALFAVMIAQMGISSLGLMVPAGIAMAIAAAGAMYAMAERNAKMQKGGMIGGSLRGTPIIVGENFTGEAIIPLEHGAVPVEITGGGGGLGDRPINIGRIEVNVVDADLVVEQVTEAVYDGVRRGLVSG